MPRHEDQNVSSSRRGFFRQLLASALGEVEKAGREMASRVRIPMDQQTQHASAPYHPPPQPWETYGPPWPPTYGPPIPLAIRHELRGHRSLVTAVDGAISRSDNPESGEADRLLLESSFPPSTPD